MERSRRNPWICLCALKADLPFAQRAADELLSRLADNEVSMPAPQVYRHRTPRARREIKWPGATASGLAIAA